MVRAEAATGLDALGLRKHGPGRWSGRGVSVVVEARWTTIRFTPTDGPPAIPFDAPGLWKDDAIGTRLFEVPMAALGGGFDDADDDGQDPTVQVVEWALATRHGAVPDTWTAPDLDVAADCDLSFRHGPFLQQARVVRQAQSLAFEVVVASVPPDLPAPRRGWLERLLVDATVVRSVRLALRDGRELVSGINLTGAPPSLTPALSAAASDLLRLTWSRLVATATCLCDPALDSRLLERSDRDNFVLNSYRKERDP